MTNTTSKIPLKTFLLLLLLGVVIVSLDDLSSPIQRLNLRQTDVLLAGVSDVIKRRGLESRLLTHTQSLRGY